MPRIGLTPPEQTDSEPACVCASGSDQIQAKFEVFDAANPAVYAELVTLAYQAYEVDPRKCSIKMMYEHARWRFKYVLRLPGEAYKLSNNYHSRYARKMMADQRYPELQGFFDVRELRSERQNGNGSKNGDQE